MTKGKKIKINRNFAKGVPFHMRCRMQFFVPNILRNCKISQPFFSQTEAKILNTFVCIKKKSRHSYLSIFLSIYLTSRREGLAHFTYMSIYIFKYLSIFLSMYLYLIVYLYIYLSIYLCIYISIYLSIDLSI